jgi:polyhydroxyalkanoate synthesis regulator phasin
MIVNVRGSSCIGIPTKDSIEIINLVPGVQEVNDFLYAKAYKTAKRLVDGGSITEEWAKEELDNIKKDDYPPELIQMCPDAKDKDKRLIPAKPLNIDRRSGDKLPQMIKECFHIPTLQKWEKEELRADIRLQMLQQIKAIEDGTVK